jgi:hypothetical protein
MDFDPDWYEYPIIKTSGGFINALTPKIAKQFKVKPDWMHPGRWRAIKKSRWGWFDPDNYEKPDIRGGRFLLNAINREIALQFLRRPPWMHRGRWRAIQNQIITNGCVEKDISKWR